MSPLELALLEQIPSGAPDAPRRPLRSRLCAACAEDLAVVDHAPRCPERAAIYRLNVNNDPQLAKLEDLLEAATRRAFGAWLRDTAPARRRAAR